jgi:hypothetical protein
MKEIREALLRKTKLIGKGAARRLEDGNEYYYMEKVKVKHKTSILGINADPYYTYHYELRFKKDDFVKDLNFINSEIEGYLKQINQLEGSLTTLKNTNQVLEQNRVKVASLESNLEQTKGLLEQEKTNLVSYIQKLSEQQRACIVADQFKAENSEYLIDTICELGFDANVLASIAIDNDNTVLLDFALNFGANLDAYSVKDKTLVQRAIAGENGYIINKVISSTKNFDNSLFYSLLQNDLASLKIILSHRPELATQLLFGDCSLLHYAIATNQLEMVNYLVSISPAAVKQNNSNGDSCLKIALRSASNEVVEIISKHVNLSDEYMRLEQCGANELINRANELHLDKVGFISVESQLTENLKIDHVNDGDFVKTNVIGQVNSGDLYMI